MKKFFSELFEKGKKSATSKTAQVGSYSTAMILVITAILVVVNLLVNSLPSSMTQLDISSAKLYSLTSSTKAVVSGLDKDVTIYWICQEGEEDTVIEKMLDRYDDLSDSITVVRKDPDIYPTFAKQYTSSTVYNNSLVVECGDKYRYIGYSDIYLADTTAYYTTGSASYSFDGEGCITSAISYVTTDELPQIYVLSGHGEATLSDSMTQSFERENVELIDFTLLTADMSYDDVDMILINAPTSDISEAESEMLIEYLDNGGKMLVLCGAQDSTTFTNLLSVLNHYGVTAAEGIVVDTDRDHYAFSAPYMLLPDIEDSDITSALLEGTHYAIVPLAQGLTVPSSSSSKVTITSLLETSSTSYSKIAGYQLETYDYEEGDIEGPFSLAVSIADSSTDGQLVWIGSSYMLDDTYNSYSSNTNLDFVIDSMNWMIDKGDQISIHTKSLGQSYLTISSSTATMLKWVMIGIIPAMYLICGIDEVVRRRKKS